MKYVPSIAFDGWRGRPWPREREGPATKSWEGCSRNLFRRNQAKLTLPPLSSYPYKYERRRLNYLLVAGFFV